MEHRKRVYQHAERQPQTVLARQDQQHFIAATGGGEQIRINWRHAQIRMAPSELLAIADFFQETAPLLKPNTLWGNAFHCIIQDEQEHFEVWLLGVGFYLGPSEFNRFAQLIHDGADTIRLLANFVSATNAEDERLH